MPSARETLAAPSVAPRSKALLRTGMTERAFRVSPTGPTRPPTSSYEWPCFQASPAPGVVCLRTRRAMTPSHIEVVRTL